MMRSFAIPIVLVAALAAAGCALAQEPPKEEPPKQNPPAEAQPDPKLDERIAGLVAQLGDDSFDKREAAQAELIKIGKPAWEPVRNVIEETKDPEVRMRATTIAEEIGKMVFTLIGKNAQGYEEYRHEMTGMVFVKLPGGTFKMGSDDGDSDAYSSEKPVHEVKVDGFMIAKYEVTQAVWEKVIGDNPSYFKGKDDPVEKVSWNKCVEFCEKTGLRLPIEAEWEYACRAGTETKYYWGDEPDEEYMWSDENSGHTPHPVGQKKPNAFGLYDMSGNVWEWCADGYGDDYYKDSPHDNPTGPSDGQYRVLRGGSWGSGALDCRSAFRSYLGPTYRNYSIGFRCVVPR